jgi:hypothetical protein
MRKRSATPADIKFPFVSQTAERAEYQRQLDAMDHARKYRHSAPKAVNIEVAVTRRRRPRRTFARKVSSFFLGQRATMVYGVTALIWCAITVIVPTEWQRPVYTAIGDASKGVVRDVGYWWEDRNVPYGTIVRRTDFSKVKVAEASAPTASPSPTATPSATPTPSPSASLAPTTSDKSGISFIRANWPSCNQNYDLVVKYAVMYKVPIDIFLAVGSAESGCRPDATNDNGANGKDRGFCQLNNLYHLPNDADAYDLEKNINYCGILLSGAWKTHGNWEEALGHFHRGPSNFADWRGKSYADGVLKRAGRLQ